MKTEIQLSQITDLIPVYISLSHVDYREDLSNKIDLLQECISANAWDNLYEELSDCLGEYQREGLEYYKNELKKSIVSKFNAEEDEAYNLVYETYRDEIEEILYENDSSNAFKDLLNNTGNFSLFIDTGLAIEEGSWNWTRSEETYWLKKIKRKLKIESNQWDNDIRIMLSQASYGGRLLVYFYDSVQELITNDDKKDFKSVLFTNPAAAIINTNCGSGDHTYLTEHKFTTVFNRQNVFIDRYFKYNYVERVCGMPKDWCKKSIAEFSFDSVKGRKTAPSPLTAQELRDKELTLIYKQGKCTFGDMDMNRHRDIGYINDFPCGNKCPHCGTFWID